MFGLRISHMIVLGRLTSWSDPNGTQSQSYDNYGRIDNSNIGDCNTESGNRYRKKELILILWEMHIIVLTLFNKSAIMLTEVL